MFALTDIQPGSTDIGEILVKVQDDLRHLKEQLTSQGLSTEAIDIGALESAIERTEQSVTDKVEQIISSSNNQVLTLPSLDSPGLTRKRQQNAPCYKSLLEPLAFANKGNWAGPNAPAPGEQAKDLRNLKILSNPSHPGARSILNDRFGVVLPEIANKRDQLSEFPGKIITGSTVDPLCTLPRGNKVDPSHTPPPITQGDAEKGILSLIERGLIPPSAELTLHPPPINHLQASYFNKPRSLEAMLLLIGSQPKHGAMRPIGNGQVRPQAHQVSWANPGPVPPERPYLSPLVNLAGLASPIFLSPAVIFRGKSKKTARASTKKKLFTKDAPAEAPSCSASFDVSKQVGVLKSFGFFDPLGIATSDVWKPVRSIVPRIGFSGGDRGRVGLGFGINTEFEPSSLEISEDERWFRRLREAELKHGRIAMLAAFGFFTAHVVRVPGFEDASEGIAAGLANESWQRISLLIFIFCGQFERNQFRQEAAREIGDFGDPLKLGQLGGFTPQMRLGELVNGRLAMLSCAIIASTEFYAGMPATQAWFPL